MNRNVKGQTLKWAARMNEQLSSCLWLLVHCSFVHCLHYVLWYSCFSFPARSLASLDSDPVLPTVMVFAVCSSSHVQISNQCFASTLCFVLFWMFVLSSTLSIWPVLSSPPMVVTSTLVYFCLDQPCTFKIHPSHFHPSQSWRCCDDDFLLSCASASCLLRLWHPTLPHVLYQLVTACPCAVYGWLCFGERCSSPKFGLLADRYHFCEKCFNEIQGETVSLGDDPTQPQTWVSAHFFPFKARFKNVQPCGMFIFMQLNWRSRMHVINCCISGLSNFQGLWYNSLELF